MKWLILGALLGLVLPTPQGQQLALGAVTALVTQPLFVAFVLGVVARPHLTKRWTR